MDQYYISTYVYYVRPAVLHNVLRLRAITIHQWEKAAFNIKHVLYYAVYIAIRNDTSIRIIQYKQE